MSNVMLCIWLSQMLIIILFWQNKLYNLTNFWNQIFIFPTSFSKQRCISKFTKYSTLIPTVTYWSRKTVSLPEEKFKVFFLLCVLTYIFVYIDVKKQTREP